MSQDYLNSGCNVPASFSGRKSAFAHTGQTKQRTLIGRLLRIFLRASLPVPKIRAPLLNDGADHLLLLVLDGSDGNGPLRRRKGSVKRRDAGRVVAFDAGEFARKA
jgi:hypothetical protein